MPRARFNSKFAALCILFASAVHLSAAPPDLLQPGMAVQYTVAGQARTGVVLLVVNDDTILVSQADSPSTQYTLPAAALTLLSLPPSSSLAPPERTPEPPPAPPPSTPPSGTNSSQASPPSAPPGDFPPDVPPPAWNPDSTPAGAVIKSFVGGQIRDIATADKPVVYRMAAGAPPVTIKTEFIGAQHVILDGCKLDLNDVRSCVDIDKDSRFIILRNCDIQDGQSGVAIAGKNVVIQGGKVHDLGNWRATSDARDDHGIVPYGPFENVWIDGVEIFHCGGDGIQVHGDGGGQRLFVTRCRMWENRQAGFNAKHGRQIIVAECEAWNHKAWSSASEGDGFMTQYGADGIWFIRNRSHHNENGFRAAGRSGGPAGPLYYYQNRIEDIAALRPPDPDVGPGYDPGRILQYSNSAPGWAVGNVALSCQQGMSNVGGSTLWATDNTEDGRPAIVLGGSSTADVAAVRAAYKAMFGLTLP